jgi:hypothetical protein
MGLKAKVNGTAKTLLSNGISLLPPSGDVSGGTCTGAGCHNYVLPTFDSWTTACPTHNGDLTINADTTLPTGGCWRDITINNNKTLYLTDTTNAYHFRRLSFAANFAKVAFGTNGKIAQGQKVTVYVEQVSNNKMNGNQFYNPLNAPHQVVFNYTGLNAFTFNGTAAFNSFFVAPYAAVTVNGNFTYNGGIWSRTLDAIGNARLYGDEESGGVPVLTDIKFALKKTSQRYR